MILMNITILRILFTEFLYLYAQYKCYFSLLLFSHLVRIKINKHILTNSYTLFFI